MDPSEDLVESLWQNATEVKMSGVFNNQETMLWKGSSAYWKTPEEKDEPFTKKMRGTGQWKLPYGYSAYISGGLIRKA